MLMTSHNAQIPTGGEGGNFRGGLGVMTSQIRGNQGTLNKLLNKGYTITYILLRCNAMLLGANRGACIRQHVHRTTRTLPSYFYLNKGKFSADLKLSRHLYP